MGKAITSIETPISTHQTKQIATDDESGGLQEEPTGTPDRGDLTQQTGGLRRARMVVGPQGKSGNVRIIYFLATEEIIYLVVICSKSVKDSLTDAEKIQLKKLTKLLEGEI